jgi:hypothetical protein
VVGFEAKGLGQIILAGTLACVASWAGLIVLLVLIITSPRNHLGAGALLGRVALAVVFAAVPEIGESSLGKWAGSGWRRIVLTSALPLMLGGIYVWRHTAPFRQSRAAQCRTLVAFIDIFHVRKRRAGLTVAVVLVE